MTRGTCNTCAFFVDAKGECRYNPPTLVLITPAKEVKSGWNINPTFKSKWPTVDADDWCSHWKTALVGGRRKTYPHQLNDGDVAEENE